MSSLGTFSSLAGPIGSLFGPAGGAIGGLVGGIGSAFSLKSQQKKAQQANEQRYQAVLNLLRTQGMASKDEVRRSGEEERGAIAQSSIGRGLYNSSVLDSLNNLSLERQSRANTAVDESVANRMAGVMESKVDEYPNMGPYSQLFQQLGANGANGGMPQIGSWLGGGSGNGQSPMASFADIFTSLANQHNNAGWLAARGVR